MIQLETVVLALLLSAILVTVLQRAKIERLLVKEELTVSSDPSATLHHYIRRFALTLGSAAAILLIVSVAFGDVVASTSTLAAITVIAVGLTEFAAIAWMLKSFSNIITTFWDYHHLFDSA